MLNALAVQMVLRPVDARHAAGRATGSAKAAATGSVATKRRQSAGHGRSDGDEPW